MKDCRVLLEDCHVILVTGNNAAVFQVARALTLVAVSECESAAESLMNLFQ